ncbi:MAG TPA: VanW family protein, partial [Candidatus Binatia bacterium]|nr:VanW family protein [Candidatus Binatia bacterium]
MTSEALPEAIAERHPAIEVPGRGPWLRLGLGFLIGLLVALAAGTAALFAYEQAYAGRILPGVRVGQVDLSGLDPAAAAARLTAAYGSLAGGEIVLVAEGQERRLPLDQVGRGPDVEAMVAAAMAVGRSGSPIERAVLETRTAIRGIELPPIVRLDETALERRLSATLASLAVRPEDASVRLVDGDFVVEPGSFGLAVDEAAVLDRLRAELAAPQPVDELAVDVERTRVRPAVTTLEAEIARLRAERMAADLVLAAGDERWTIETATVREWLRFALTSDGRYLPVVDPDRVSRSLGGLAKTVAREPRNARFLTGRNGQIVGVEAGVEGRRLDVGPTVERIVAALNRRGAEGIDEPVELAFQTVAPALTTEDAEKIAPRMTKISEWTTYFPIGEKNGFGANIWIPAMDIDGYVVGPGETFDFWKAIGPITRERGYRDGGAIINGRTEPQGALAGGICSTSTTLFNAALRAGFKMGARRNHYYYIDRYPLGLDATVFRSASGSVQTMSWTNDTPYPVLIRGYKIRNGNRGYVKFELWSVPNGRTVTFSKPIVKNVRKASDTIEYTDTLPAGTRQRVEYPVDGMDVWVTRTVRDGSGRIIHQETYYSHYARITGVVLVGTGGSRPSGGSGG